MEALEKEEEKNRGKRFYSAHTNRFWRRSTLAGIWLDLVFPLSLSSYPVRGLS